MFEQTDPKTLMKWLILAAIVYFLMPYDLIPDLLGVPGRIDDVLMMAWLAWFYRNHLRQYFASATGQASASGGGGASSRSGSESESEQTALFDPYDVLGVPRAAPPDAIKAAYRARMKEYHPDKVTHLGDALQELAHEKSQEIERAYRELCG